MPLEMAGKYVHGLFHLRIDLGSHPDFGGQ